MIKAFKVLAIFVAGAAAGVAASAIIAKLIFDKKVEERVAEKF